MTDFQNIRLSARVLLYLEGTSAWESPDERLVDPDPCRLMDKIKAQLRERTPRKDGSITLPLTRDERNILLDYAEWFADAASSDAGWDRDALGDLNAGRALARQLIRSLT